MGGTKSKESKSTSGDKTSVPPTIGVRPSEGRPSHQATASQKLAKPTLPKHCADRWAIPAKYVINKIIGKGSYGSVCEATDRDLSCSVAIKQVKHLFDDLIDCKRILREIAILSRLSHPNIVRLHDVVISEDDPTYNELYIIMELCESDMKKLRKTDVTLTPLHINTLLYNLLVGVKYLHSAGIYHRDLKPDNCLVNQDCSVKICDFGLSMAMGAQPSSEDMLEHPSAVDPTVPHGPIVPSSRRMKRVMTKHVVTRWYRAPELILLQRNYTHAIDIWSVGCIFAELIQMETSGVRVVDRGPLFPGSSCYPLSPDRKSHRGRQAHDQLTVIFDILGTPPSDDIAQLEPGEGKRYLEGLEHRTGSGLVKKYPFAEAKALRLLDCMLQFSPKKRITVSGALEHEIFAGIRDASQETTASESVALGFDKEVNMQETRLRQCFAAEMQFLKEGSRQVPEVSVSRV